MGRLTHTVQLLMTSVLHIYLLLEAAKIGGDHQNRAAK